MPNALIAPTTRGGEDSNESEDTIAQNSTQGQQPERFAPVPEGLLTNPDVSGEAVRLYGLMLLRAGEKRGVAGSLAMWGKLMGGKSASQVRRLVRQLTQVGWLKSSTREGRADVYYPRRANTLKSATRMNR